MTSAANLPTPPTDRHATRSIDPAVVQGIREASRASHIDFGYLMAQAAQESGFRSDAKAATSSATGLFQFIDSTWLDMVRQHGAQHGLGQLAQQVTTDTAGRPTVADPAVRERILALRKDPAVSAALAAEYAKSNKAELERATGRPVHSTDLYLAHFLGASGATELIRAAATDGARPAAQLLPEAAAANPAVFYDAKSGEPRTAADLYRSFAARIERSTADFAQLGDAPSGVASPRAPSWLPGPITKLATPLASVFDVMMTTALKLLGGEPSRGGLAPARAADPTPERRNHRSGAA